MPTPLLRTYHKLITIINEKEIKINLPKLTQEHQKDFSLDKLFFTKPNTCQKMGLNWILYAGNPSQKIRGTLIFDYNVKNKEI